MATAIPRSRWKTDWTKCCLCQEDRDQELKSPPTRYTIEQDGYSMIGKNIPMFESINEMPIKFDPACLEEGNGVEETLRANKAKYHQSCRGLFSNTRLAQARKRSANCSSPQAESSSKLRRASLDNKNSNICFLCEQQSSPSELRQAMTMKLNK